MVCCIQKSSSENVESSTSPFTHSPVPAFPAPSRRYHSLFTISELRLIVSFFPGCLGVRESLFPLSSEVKNTGAPSFICPTAKLDPGENVMEIHFP